MCGCSKANAMWKQQQNQVRNGLASPRPAARLTPPPPQPPARMAVAMTPPKQTPLNSNDRRRIQQLNQEAIRRSLNKR